MTLGWPRPGPVVAAGDDAGPWGGGITLEHVALVHDVAVPLRRVLLMMGHQTSALYFRYPSSGLEWAHIDPGLSQAGGIDEAEVSGLHSTGQPWNARWIGPTLALAILPIMDARNPGLSMAIEFFSGSTWEVDAGGGFLYVGYDEPSAAPTAQNPSETAQRLKEAVDACAQGLMVDGLDRFTQGDLAPDTACGLFWLIDPMWWRQELETGQREPSRHGRQVEKVGTYARNAIVEAPDTGGIFAEQVSGVRPPDVLPADFEEISLANVILVAVGWMFGKRVVASLYADKFFNQIPPWLVERGEEHLLPEQVIDELRHAPWFEILVTLVDAGVLTPTALGDSALAEDQLPDPVVAVRVSQNVVALFVFDVFLITLARVRDEDGAAIQDQELPGDDKSLVDPIEDFTWDWVSPADAATPPPLYLVAAPGVFIDIPAEPEPDGWAIQVVRVPDRALVPEWGTAVQPHLLLAPYAVTATDLIEELDAAHAVLVSPKQDGGVRLTYPVSEIGEEGQLVVEVTLPPGEHVDGSPHTGAMYSGDERYAFDIFYYVDWRYPHYLVPYISVWATSGVQVAVRQVVPPDDLVLENWRLPCDVWEVPSYPSVPAFGEPLPFNMDRFENLSAFATGWEPPWTLEDSLRPEQRFSAMDVETIMTFWWVYLCADLVIGMIPIVGNVADLAELASALYAGQDKYGRPVANMDIALMSLGVLVPLVSSGMAKSMGRDVVGLTLGGSADDLIQAAIRPGGLTRAIVREATEKSTTWWRLDPLARRGVLTEIQALVGPAASRFATQLQGEFLLPEEVLNEAVNGMRNGELQRSFRQWAARRLAAGESVTVEEYMRSGVRGHARVILQTLCGNDAFPTGLRARRAPSTATRYRSFGHIQFRPGPPAHQWLVDRKHDVLAEVRDIVLRRKPPRIWTNQTYLSDADIIARAPDEYVERVERLLASLTATGDLADLSVADLQKIVGRKQFYQRELAEMLVVAMDVLEHDMRQMGRSLDDVLPVGAGDGRPLEGLSGYFQLMITGSGYEHSTRFETLIVGDELAHGATVDTLRWGLPLRVSPLTNTMGSGPDVVTYVGGLARLRQGKSYSGMRDLVADSSWEDMVTGEWHGPEVLRQLWTDLQRLGITGFDVPGPPGSLAMVRIDGEIRFTVDVQYYYMKLLDRTGNPDRLVDRLYAELSPTVEDQFTAYLNKPAVRAFLKLPDDLVITLKLDFL